MGRHGLWKGWIKMDENKQLICDLLTTTLQATSGAWDLVSLTYHPAVKGVSGETVTVLFRNGYAKEVNVNLDSGTAMIKDIMKVF